MDSPDPPKKHYVRCMKCNKILECSRYDTNALLEHIRSDHPEIEIVDNKNMPRRSRTPERQQESGPTCDNTPAPSSPSMPQRSETRYGTSDHDFLRRAERVGICRSEMPSSECNSDRSKDHSSCAHRHDMQSTPCSDRIGHSRSLYRTSIEKWRPANGTIFCPSCGTNQRPLIRTQAERSSNNSCCAVCILGCWPFCFLPFLLPSDNKEYLHCSNCKTFLGLYDRESNCIRPNRDFVHFADEQNHDKSMNEPSQKSSRDEFNAVRQRR